MILEATQSVDNEINPWLSAAARFDEAAARLGLELVVEAALSGVAAVGCWAHPEGAPEATVSIINAAARRREPLQSGHCA